MYVFGGGGTRQCVGKRAARTITFPAARLLAQHSLRPCVTHPFPYSWACCVSLPQGQVSAVASDGVFRLDGTVC
eukprot:1137916-Pelagomonas_calceolata.AAC.6